MAIVVLAEKPSVARDIARVLGANQRGNGYIHGNGYVVTWALGHLIHFVDPNEYGGSWAQRWSFSQLPMIPRTWLTKPIDRTKDQYKIVKALFLSDRVEEIICATDAGREGENIFRLIYQHIGCTKPFKRLWVSSLTDEAISEGFRKLHEGSEFDPLARAAQARAQADWLIGLNMTRAYTVRHGALYTIGRVQTPTLGMIVSREIIITQFEKVFYYEIESTFTEGFKAKYLHTDEKGKESRIDIKAEAERLLARFKEKDTGTITSVNRRTKKNKPPQLYDLINLQKDANRRFNLTASETLTVAQALYEKHKLITYPRTESRHISEDMVAQLPGILKSLNHPQAQQALQALQGGLKLSKNYVDKTKLSDHHGIIPTNRRPSATLPRDAQAIYDLVVARFVGIFLPDNLVEETTMLIDIDKATFRAKGSEVKQEGWKIVEARRKKEGDESRKLPDLKKGDIVHIKDMEMLEKETAPPKRYTDATLLTAMKNAGREVEDDALAEAMKEQGLGTPATRAEILEKLIRTRLVERKKKVLYPTEKGMALISVVDESLKSPELTGAWEQKLKEIEDDSFEANDFYQSICQAVVDLMPVVRSAPRLQYRDPDPKRDAEKKEAPKTSEKSKSTDSKNGANNDFGSCPKCGKGQVIEGKTAYGCNQFRNGCRFTFPKEIWSKKLSARQIGDLLKKGKTSVIKGFKGDDGNKFEARLSLDENHNIKLEDKKESAPKKDEPITCPKCHQGTIIEGAKGFGCNRFRDGCKMVIWKEMSGKTLTSKQIETLIRKGKTGKIKGFTSKQGKKFEAKLVLDGDQVRFDFD